MQSDDNRNHYEGALLEEIRNQNKAILEVVGSMQDNVKKIPKIVDDIEIIKTDVKAIKAVIKDHSGQLDDNESRITQLEAA